jgi:hypothetical protein
MTINEAIEHSLEVANQTTTCTECKNEHKQLAEWLLELKTIKEAKPCNICKEDILDHELKTHDFGWFSIIDGITYCPNCGRKLK